MAQVILDGRPVVRATIHRPRIGVWHADLEVDSEKDLPSSQVTLSIADGKLQLFGVARATGIFHGLMQVRMVGGAGGFTRAVTPKYYRRAPLRIPLNDILAAAGEHVATSADVSILGTHLLSWSIFGGEAGQALTALLAKVPTATWRMTASGAVWVGVEAWPAVTLDHVVTNEDKALGWMELASEDPTLTAGVTLDGRKVSNVVHRYEPGSVRSEVWFE
jgi:hypothetical protein